MAEKHIKNKLNSISHKKYFDLSLLFITFFLCMFGLIMIFSAGSTGGNSSLSDIIKQVAIIITASVGTYILARLPFSVWENASVIIFLVSIVMLFLVKTPLGISSHGASRWISVGPVSIQPAEIVKIATIFYVGAIINRCKNTLGNTKVIMLIFAPVVLASGLILILTRNLSSAFIVGFIALIMYFTFHPHWKRFLIVSAVILAIAVIAIIYIKNMDVTGMDLDKLGSFRSSRIIAWLHPEEFADDQSMQTLNALYAIGSGGLFGKGLGGSIQKAIIPEVQNDMIFAVICEELGLFGAFVLMFLFVVLLYRIVFIATRTTSSYGRIISVGVFTQLATQIVLNIGVNTNMLPNTGVTLPFISNGGSAVAILIFEIGLVLKASRYIPVEQ